MPTLSYTPPYPTLIEYSGYGYANPAGPENGIAVLANLMGFAVVDVNMRGTGCSGGAFDFFEHMQNLDGYDVIETIAHQPWVLGQQGGHARHLLRRHQPAVHGAAAPARPRCDRAAVGDRRDSHDALSGRHPSTTASRSPGPNSASRTPNRPVRARSGMGVRTGPGRRSDVRGQSGPPRRGGEPDGEDRANSTYNPAVADPLDPVTFVNNINVPTFMACQWEDEQTGGHCADLAQHFTGTKLSGSRSPTAPMWTRSIPIRTTDCSTSSSCSSRTRHRSSTQAVVRAAAPVVYQEAMGLPKTDLVTLPADPIQLQPSYESARSEFEALPAIRVLFDNGAGTSPTGSTTAGDPYPGFEQSFTNFPIPGTKPRTWYFGPGGTLDEQQPTASKGSTPTPPMRARRRRPISAPTPARAVCGATRPSGNGTGAAGGKLRGVLCVGAAHDRHHRDRRGAVHLWVESSTPDVDLEKRIEGLV